MVGVAPVHVRAAAGEHTPAVTHRQRPALLTIREALLSAEVEWHTELVEDDRGEHRATPQVGEFLIGESLERGGTDPERIVAVQDHREIHRR